jgi:replicative DNA helicase Mcm
MLILAMVGGQKVEYGQGDHDRGEFHVLLLGDPGTGKSKLISRVEELGWRTVGVSGKGAKTAGVTAAATRDDFSETGEWTLDSGAFVKANGGVVCIDELDDMPENVRSSMLEPMSKQSIHITKAGINTKLQTETAVVAAGNPKYGRFDQYEPLHQQFDIGSTLLSRFDLIFTVTDRPDPDEDAEISGHILETRDAAKRQMRGNATVEDDDAVSTPVEPELLRKWIALAKQQPAPVFEDESVKDWLQESFHNLRGMHGYDEDATVPVTFRKLEGIIRIAEASAKFRFSDTIEMRDAKEATKAVGQSMQDYGTNEDGELDAGVQEAGTSKSQAERMKALGEVMQELQGSSGGVPKERVVAELGECGIAEGKAWDAIESALEEGSAYEPATDAIRWVGRA